MAAIDNLMSELDERNLAQVIAVPHDSARARFPLRRNTVENFDEYQEVLGDYLNRQFSECVTRGGALPRAEAASRAKEILEREYRRRNGDIVSAFNDAHDGTNGGLRAQLDTICDALKNESLDRYIRDAFDRHVRPNAWPEKVAMIRSLIARFGSLLGSSIQTDNPERYAHDYHALVQSLVQALQRTSSMFRRL
jgi:hypothetical protein